MFMSCVVRGKVCSRVVSRALSRLTTRLRTKHHGPRWNHPARPVIFRGGSARDSAGAAHDDVDDGGDDGSGNQRDGDVLR